MFYEFVKLLYVTYQMRRLNTVKMHHFQLQEAYILRWGSE